jgi:chromate transport protein ChrA
MSPSVDNPTAQPTNHGFLQHFGLDIRVAALVLIVDNLVFTATWMTAGLLYGVEAVAGVVLGYITYKIQRYWYGDDHHSAMIKALVVALLTAIPVPLSTLLPVGTAGFLGFLHMLLPKRGNRRP